MTRRSRWVLWGAMAVVVGAAVAMAGAVDMEPGEWRITTKTTIEGMPMSPPPTTFTHTQCLTEEDLVPDQGGGQKGQSSDCTVEDQKISGNTVTWSVVCKNPQMGTMKGTGSITYSGTSFSGKSTMTMPMGGQTMTMRSTMNGKRLGDCAK